ncbi:alpha/beta fold hydrolase [Falsiroseomonas tokyonensis]|uniref:Alpha/beta fold hydrolase n=1 Tax=Falsiroseomonas tokyonensis TaxID=430521 RepID=A0ABV7C0S4_9PROT|nr:alpha/beta fold hydrolase [Falsiroseomonas tokyonensis]MBU8541277.1 alpha/beta fold hydrolase [Falsiroseomonas tokyonensis]
MKTLAFARRAALMIGLALAAAPALAADFPAPRDHSWVARDFRFHTGEVMPELRIGYTTVGEPGGIPVLVLHGTAGNARNMLVQSFAGQLFGEGQPLDAKRHFIIIPDAIGTGRSSKPSDGLRGAFPRYNYDDMVAAQHRLVTEGLGIPRLRLVIGNSMGGMHAWLWGTNFPDAMDAIVPMASQPTEMSSRNWMLRRLMVESVRRDPGYANGFYTQQPASLGRANVVFATATNGGTLNLQKIAPTREAADRLVEQRLAAPPPADANDFVYQWDSSRDYNPAPRLERIRAQVLAINAADDERNPPETGLMQAAMQRVANGRLLLIPASAETLGHGTTGQARFWAEDLRAFLRGLE